MAIALFEADLLHVHYESAVSGVTCLRRGRRTKMPAEWEKRLVQTSAVQGQEVAPLRRAVKPGYLIVGTATEGMCKIRIAVRP